MVNKTRSYAGGIATKVRVLYVKYKEKNEPIWFVFSAFGGDNKTRRACP